MSKNLHRLVIVSHVVHYRHNGRLYAYGAYAREIDIWADLFPEILIAAPCRREAPPGDAAVFTRENISIRPLPEVGGEQFLPKLRLVLTLPWLCWRLVHALRGADAVHVRCPGNWGLLGAVVAPLLYRRRVAKYSNQWPNYPGEAYSCRFQKALLRSRWWSAPVTVYGNWLRQPEHVIPFFTSVMTAEQVADAARVARHKRFGTPMRVLYVGRLSKSKNVHVLLAALAVLRREGVMTECDVVGDGPLREELESQVHQEGLGQAVRFHGGVGFEQVLELYARAQVLVLASETEGWPKAIAEGMAFGLVCVGANRGLVPEMLSNGRGVVVAPGNVQELAAVLRELALNPARCASMSGRAAEWARKYSLEGLREALRELLNTRWKVQLRATTPARDSSLGAEHR